MVSTTFVPIQELRVQLPPPIDRFMVHDPGIVIMIDDPVPDETERSLP
jgi:hypothetical protein